MIACLAIEFNISNEGVWLKVCTAAPLTAGLLFGGPAGVLAGVIGGVYRLVSVLWGIDSYGMVASLLAMALAGFIGAACRKYMFDDKRRHGHTDL